MADLSAATDGLLAGRAADGDTLAFAVLVRRHNAYLRAFATRLTGSAADADDVVQEALISAWSALPALEDRTKVRAWLLSIVSRKATDRIRSRKPTAQLDERQPDATGHGPEEAAVLSSRLQALGAVLATLPDSQRQCWVLKEVQGLSYDEIADELGTSVTTVRGRLARARATVIREMEGWR